MTGHICHLLLFCNIFSFDKFTLVRSSSGAIDSDPIVLIVELVGGKEISAVAKSSLTMFDNSCGAYKFHGIDSSLSCRLEKVSFRLLQEAYSFITEEHVLKFVAELGPMEMCNVSNFPSKYSADLKSRAPVEVCYFLYVVVIS